MTVNNTTPKAQDAASEVQTKWAQPKDVDAIQLAFPAGLKDLLPTWDEIPDDFKRDRTMWNKVVSTWFFCGLKDAKWTPKDGIDTQKALRHIKVCMGSWEPKHEHKESGVAYLMSLWFHDVKYSPAKGGGG